MYQYLYARTKKAAQRDACMKFYDAAVPLYLEIDASGISLGARQFQVRDYMNCGHCTVSHLVEDNTR